MSIDPDAGPSPPTWPSQIIAGHHTLSGVPPRAPSRFSFRARLEAASAAGYGGVGLAYQDYLAQRDRGETDVSLREAVEATGVPVVELDILYGWNTPDEQRASREAEAWLHQMAALFGARHMNVAVSQPPEADLDLGAVSERFGAVCDRAAGAGLRVGLEFQPLNAIPNLRTAWGVVQRAGRDNGGIQLDSWHFFRGDPDFNLLREIPPERIIGVQINDAAVEVIGSLWEDTTRRRLLPGDGTFPLERFVETLRAIDVDCPLAVEIISDDHMASDLDAMARRSYEATRSVLGR